MENNTKEQTQAQRLTERASLTTDAFINDIKVGEELLDVVLEVQEVFSTFQSQKQFFSAKCLTSDGSLVLVKSFGSAAEIIGNIAATGNIVAFSNLKATKAYNSGYSNTCQITFNIDLLYTDSSNAYVVSDSVPIMEVDDFTLCKDGGFYRVVCNTIGTLRLVLKGGKEYGGVKIIDTHQNKGELYIKTVKKLAFDTLQDGTTIIVTSIARRSGEVVKFFAESFNNVSLVKYSLAE